MRSNLSFNYLFLLQIEFAYNSTRPPFLGFSDAGSLYLRKSLMIFLFITRKPFEWEIGKCCAELNSSLTFLYLLFEINSITQCLVLLELCLFSRNRMKHNKIEYMDNLEIGNPIFI